MSNDDKQVIYQSCRVCKEEREFSLIGIQEMPRDRAWELYACHDCGNDQGNIRDPIYGAISNKYGFGVFEKCHVCNEKILKTPAGVQEPFMEDFPRMPLYNCPGCNGTDTDEATRKLVIEASKDLNFKNSNQ